MMSAETDQEPAEPTGRGRSGKRSRQRKAAKAINEVRLHVGAVLAAFGLAALVHQLGVNWRGALAPILGFWDLTVRPVATWVFHYLVTVPIGWLGVPFEVPLWVRDYLSVGIILALSFTRTIRNRPDLLNSLLSDSFARARRSLLRFWAILILRPRLAYSLAWAYILLLWPIALPTSTTTLLIRIIGNLRGRLTKEQLHHLQEAADSVDETADQSQAIAADVATMNLFAARFHQEDFDIASQIMADFIRIFSPILYLVLLLAVNTWVMPYV
jgi:hypothetical protein